MKKLIYGGVFLAIVGISFVGCKKEIQPKQIERVNQNQSSNTVENDVSPEETEFLNNLNSELKKAKANFSLAKTTVNPEFNLNPFDTVGINHNLLLEEIHNHPNFTKDQEVAIQISNDIYRKSTGKSAFTDTDEALATINAFSLKVVSNGELNYSWINSLNIPFLEKQTLNIYFLAVYATDNIALRVTLSKIVESAVINSFFYSSASKERLLRCFSVFRHSTFYWSTFDKYAGISPFSEAVDALVQEMCLDGTITMDGFDLSCNGAAYQFGQLYSAVADILFRI